MPKIDKAYAGLREQASHMTAKDLALDSADGRSHVLGVVTDWALDNGVATITAFSTGDASLYVSSGGGVIGGIGHENVRRAAKSVIDTASQSLALLKPAADFPLPTVGRTRFSVLAIGGNVSDEFATNDLGEGKHALSALFFAVQELISQLRLTK